ncbi:MAG: hypothetical protein LBH59_04820, partial [Planctomycetaceae bacterium]|nr:hypothetical protein [Planctomycetaceae bacterium]
MKFFDLFSLCRFGQTGFILSSYNNMPKPFLNQEAEHGKRNNVERLFKGEAYRPYRLRYIVRLFCLVFVLLFFSSCNQTSVKENGGDPSKGGSVTVDPMTLPEVKTEVENAIAAFNKSDINSAKNILADLYKKHRGLQPPGIFLFQFFAQTRQGNIIKPVLDMTTNETPDDPEAYILLGDIALQQRELTAAELLFKEGESKLSGYSVNTERKKRLTSLLLRVQSTLAEVRGRWEAYGQLADKRIKHDGESAPFLRQKGIALFQQKKDSEAAALFAKADTLTTTDSNQNNAVQGLPTEAMLSRLYLG